MIWRAPEVARDDQQQILVADWRVRHGIQPRTRATAESSAVKVLAESTSTQIPYLAPRFHDSGSTFLSPLRSDGGTVRFDTPAAIWWSYDNPDWGSIGLWSSAALSVIDVAELSVDHRAFVDAAAEIIRIIEQPTATDLRPPRSFERPGGAGNEPSACAKGWPDGVQMRRIVRLAPSFRSNAHRREDQRDARSGSKRRVQGGT